MSVSSTFKDDEHQLCRLCYGEQFSIVAFLQVGPFPLVLPPVISTPVKFIIIIIRMCSHNALSSNGFHFLRSVFEINK